MDTVILPVAGKGSRLLPLTKVTPKELLPVFDRPVIQFAIDEAIAAGAKRLVVVTHQDKPGIADYFKPHNDAVETFRSKQKHDLADALEDCGTRGVIEVVLVHQDQALGLGHAILCAADSVLDGPVGVILPDDVIFGDPCLAEMVTAYRGGHMVAAMEVPQSDVSKYGIFDVAEVSRIGEAIPATGMVEKPTLETAPSQLAAVGRYILDADIFEALRTIPRGAGDEYQLTDAIASMIEAVGLSALPFSGTRYDCGNHEGLLNASMARSEHVRNGAHLVTAAE